MKPHLTTSATTRHAHNRDGTAAVAAHPSSLGDPDAGRVRAARGRAHLTLASAPVWRHKLILTGKLNDRTAVELEDEIECLREEGVTSLTLDLRQLAAIDSVGARAIAYCGATCKRQGRDFTVIPGSAGVHRVLAEAGAESLLVGDPREAGLVRLSTGHSDRSSRDTSTVMVKRL